MKVYFRILINGLIIKFFVVRLEFFVLLIFKEI